MGESIPLHVLHAFYVRTCVCTLCAHYPRACTARMCTARMCTLTYFRTDSLQNLWRHSLGHRNVHGIIDFTRELAFARYARVCTHIHSCVRSHIFGRNRSNICENIPLHVLYAFYVRTCVCTLCACVHCTHVRAHIF
jgi:hypothetical protein